LLSDKRKITYFVRQYIIAPIFRHLKFNVRYRDPQLQGLEKADTEFKCMFIGTGKNIVSASLLIIAGLLFFVSSLSSAATFTAFGPEAFIRKTGQPVVETTSFTVKNPDTTYTLCVYNGGTNPEYKRVSSAIVTLNGSTVFGTNDFNQQVSVLKKQVTVSAGNELQVELRSQPGSALTVIVEGRDEIPPDVAITSPENGARLNTPTIAVTGNASDSISWIKSVTVNGISAGLTEEIYTSDIQLTEGQNTITATATDAAGNTNTATVTITLDSIPPAVASATPADNDIDISLSTTITATFSEEIDASTITTTTFTVNSETSGTVSGSVTYNDNTATFTPTDDLSPNTTYTVTIKSGNAGVKDLAGNILSEDYTWSFKTESRLEIIITEPQNGETINKAYTMIKGTIKTATNDIGIKINGILAEINGEDWAASNIPLTSGDNTITVEAADVHGNTAQESITIHTGATDQPIMILVTPKSGIAPLSTSFSLDTGIGGTITTYTIDFDGDGTTDLEQATDEGIAHIYDTQGLYYPVVTIEDSSGNRYTETAVINVLSKDGMDTLLKGKWNGMKKGLQSGDITITLTYFAEGSQERYKGIFTALQSNLAEIAANMQEIGLIYIKDGMAKYRIRRQEEAGEITYYIYFQLDKDGLWRIRQF